MTTAKVYIRYKGKDPRAGTIERLDEKSARRYLEFGYAEQVSDEEGAAAVQEAEEAAARLAAEEAREQDKAARQEAEKDAGTTSKAAKAARGR